MSLRDDDTIGALELGMRVPQQNPHLLRAVTLPYGRSRLHNSGPIHTAPIPAAAYGIGSEIASQIVSKQLTRAAPAQVALNWAATLGKQHAILQAQVLTAESGAPGRALRHFRPPMFPFDHYF